MPLQAGTRLGHYEILEALGAGGMGEVYRARDPRLDRSVAVKVLPAHLSSDPALRQRFEREAKAISQLSHPHICVLHDVGHEGGIDFLVMEHLEGETLAERLARGPLPPAEVLSTGIAIADALDRAHRQGIVHRDLKPGNVMLTRSGPKLLDFGLARTLAPGGGSSVNALTSLPTEAAGSQPLTAEGTLLGTFQYMAPEQLEGAEADARTDLFAFGALLYEMATGRPAFSGKSRASLISSIMASTPPAIATVQPLAPPALDRVIQTCLAKDPDERVQTAHDVKLQLQWIAEGGSQAGVPVPLATRRRSRERLAWVVAAVAAVTAVALGVMSFARTPEAPRMLKFVIDAPPGVTGLRTPLISPDGLHLAFVARDSGGTERIWVRPLGDFQATPLIGTEGVVRPFWSPDSRFLAYISGGKLRKVSITGGAPQTISDTPDGEDGDWGPRDIVLYDTGDSLFRVAAAGGVFAPASRLDRSLGDLAHGWPEFLPDGKHFLFLVYGNDNSRGLAVGSIDDTVVKRLPGGPYSNVRYAPSGHLVFARDGTLFAQPFDPRRLDFTADPVPIAERVPTTGFGMSEFSVSENGTIAYRRGSSGHRDLVWFDREGRRLGTAGPPGNIQNPVLSPDGRRVAMRRQDPTSGDMDVWTLDVVRGTLSRFTFDPEVDSSPLWSPDGEWLAFGSARDSAGADIYRKRANGVGEMELLVESKSDTYPTSWSSDGRILVYWEVKAAGDTDLKYITIDGDRTPVTILATPNRETDGMLSPDGRWLAYTSNESGRLEVYVQGFPETHGKWQISVNGGSWPSWRADGREMFYVSADQRMMAVEVEGGTAFDAGIPQPLFTLPTIGLARNRYDVTRDGQRFLAHVPEGDETASPIHVVIQWPAALER
jgi:serine/threonine protein kinase